MYGLAPIGYLSGAGLKVTESSRGGGRGVSQRDFNGTRRSREVPTSGGVGELCGRAARPVLSPLKKKKKKFFFSFLAQLAGVAGDLKGVPFIYPLHSQPPV